MEYLKVHFIVMKKNKIC